MRLAEGRALAREVERWPRAVDAIVVGLLCPTEPACGRDLCALCIARAAAERARAEIPELPPVFALTTCSVPRYHFPPDVAEVLDQAGRPVPWLGRPGVRDWPPDV